MKLWGRFLLLLMLCGCNSVPHVPADFISVPVQYGRYTIMTYQRLLDRTSPVHIYIEGDGYAFDAAGRPTNNPTPKGSFVRDLAARDTSPNVVYMARPCQYVMSPACTPDDWTMGRFSPDIIESMAAAVRGISNSRPVVLIGYSGGAMISGLIINHYPDIPVTKWITIAGVLRHADWTAYFDDKPLSSSLDMIALPNVNQLHYIAAGDTVVPNKLSKKWIKSDDIVVVHGAKHSYFPSLILDL